MLYIGKFILLISTEALSRYRVLTRVAGLQPVLWIRIRMDPELLPGSGSGIKVPNPDPAKSERAYK